MNITKHLLFTNLWLFIISIISLTYLHKYYFIETINSQLLTQLMFLFFFFIVLILIGIIFLGDNLLFFNLIFFFLQLVILVTCCYLMDSKSELIDIFFENDLFKIQRKWSQKELNQICKEYFSLNLQQWNFTRHNREEIVAKVWNNTRTYAELVNEINKLIEEEQPISNILFQLARFVFTNPAALNIVFAYTVVLLQYFLWLPPGG